MNSNTDDLNNLLARLRAYCAHIAPGEVPQDFRITFLSGRKLQHPIPPAPITGPPARKAAYSHSSDFRAVHWFGADYTFTPTQAAVVRTLWEAWEDGVPELGIATILEAAGSESDRLPPLFHGHAAWGSMIVKGDGKGTYRLDSQ